MVQHSLAQNEQVVHWGGGSHDRPRSRALGNESVLLLPEPRRCYAASLDNAGPWPATILETDPAGGPAPAHGEQTERVDLKGFGPIWHSNDAPQRCCELDTMGRERTVCLVQDRSSCVTTAGPGLQRER